MSLRSDLGLHGLICRTGSLPHHCTQRWFQRVSGAIVIHFSLVFMQDVRDAALEFLFNLAVSNGPLTQQTLRWLVTSLTPSPADVAYLGSLAAAQQSANSQAQPQAQQPLGARNAQTAASVARGKQDSASGQSGSELSADVSLAIPGMPTFLARIRVGAHSTLCSVERNDVGTAKSVQLSAVHQAAAQIGVAWADCRRLCVRCSQV